MQRIKGFNEERNSLERFIQETALFFVIFDISLLFPVS